MKGQLYKIIDYKTSNMSTNDQIKSFTFCLQLSGRTGWLLADGVVMWTRWSGLINLWRVPCCFWHRFTPSLAAAQKLFQNTNGAGLTERPLSPSSSALTFIGWLEGKGGWGVTKREKPPKSNCRNMKDVKWILLLFAGRSSLNVPVLKGAARPNGLHLDSTQQAGLKPLRPVLRWVISFTWKQIIEAQSSF